MFFNQALDLHKENEALKQHINRLEEALREIANQDYRGSRSTESQIAFRALEEKP
jgi:cell division protein FtsB